MSKAKKVTKTNKDKKTSKKVSTKKTKIAKTKKPIKKFAKESAKFIWLLPPLFLPPHSRIYFLP